MSKIFISHSSHDAEFATAFASVLRELGHAPWRFGEKVLPGERWEAEIVSQLRDADALVILVSPESMGSTWVSHELGVALAYSEEKGKPAIIPLMLGDIELQPPLSRFLGIRAERHDAEAAAIEVASALDMLEARSIAKAERQSEVHKLIEVSAADFVQKSLQELRERETSYRRLAYIWYGAAYLTLVGSAGFGVYRALLINPETKDWLALVELAISGVIVLGLLIALAKYAFTLGKSFMVEALRNADRRHAISFGEFYLRAFGADAKWADVKDAFQNWNIDKGSYFIGQSPAEFDPQIYAVAVEVAKNFSKAGTGSKI